MCVSWYINTCALWHELLNPHLSPCFKIQNSLYRPKYTHNSVSVTFSHSQTACNDKSETPPWMCMFLCQPGNAVFSRSINTVPAPCTYLHIWQCMCDVHVEPEQSQCTICNILHLPSMQYIHTYTHTHTHTHNLYIYNIIYIYNIASYPHFLCDHVLIRVLLYIQMRLYYDGNWNTACFESALFANSIDKPSKLLW